MALPVRIECGRQINPFDVVRNDLNMLGRFLGFGEEGDGGTSLATLANYGVDVREDANHVYVEADLPGFRKEDVDISLENGVLTLTAERREETTEPADQQRQDQKQKGNRQQESNYLLRERRVQRFVRSLSLPPSAVDEQNVQARLENGVLKITLNKREESKPKHIEVS
jgi:HSP20 family protein